MAIRMKPAKAKSKAPVKTVKSGTIKPVKKAAPPKKAAPARKVAAAKKPSRKPVVTRKLVATRKPAAAKKVSTPLKKPAPVVKSVAAVKAAPGKPIRVVAPVKAVAPAAGKIFAKPKAALTAMPQRPVVPEIIPPVPEVGRDYMNPMQRDFYRKLLRNQRNELMAELEHTIHHMQDESVNLPDPNDRASQEADMTLELRSRDRETKLIHKIDEAIARLEAGEYGYCESCGEPIGRGRLEARPTATLCIDCKRLDEIREKQVA